MIPFTEKPFPDLQINRFGNVVGPMSFHNYIQPIIHIKFIISEPPYTTYKSIIHKIPKIPSPPQPWSLRSALCALGRSYPPQHHAWLHFDISRTSMSSTSGKVCVRPYDADWNLQSVPLKRLPASRSTLKLSKTMIHSQPQDCVSYYFDWSSLLNFEDFTGQSSLT